MNKFTIIMHTVLHIVTYYVAFYCLVLIRELRLDYELCRFSNFYCDIVFTLLPQHVLTCIVAAIILIINNISDFYLHAKYKRRSERDDALLKFVIILIVFFVIKSMYLNFQIMNETVNLTKKEWIGQIVFMVIIYYESKRSPSC